VAAAAVELVNVSKRYGDVQALKDVSLTIDSGEVVAMLGPNGAGKTTSISVMLGTRKPTSGQARLFGLDPRDLKSRSRIGVMLQESGVPAMLKVEEIVGLFSSYYPSPLRLSEAIALAGLDEKAKSLVKDLSGGQRQRLYLALAICGNPDVLFLDEPTVGMDVEGRHRFLEEIADLAAKGRTVVLTTHYLEEADQLARRIVVIDRGHVIADSTPAEIKARVAGKRISFTTSQPLSESDLDGLPLNSKQIADHSVRLLTNEAEEVLREIFRRGIDVQQLEVVGADLEEAFIAMTHHEGAS
jgi:ABC-2 type transport system ATP-binding protein